MRKGLTTLLVILLAVGAMLVSCKAEVGTPADELVSASFELDSSRALSATLEPFAPGSYYWKYAARKNVADTSGLTSGETAGYDDGSEAREEGAEWIHEGTPGLDGKVSGFSQGLWDFTLYAYKRAGEGTTQSPYEYTLVYAGEATAVTLQKNVTNTVHVVVSPVAGANGTLYIGTTSLNPKNVGDKQTVSVSRFIKVVKIGETEERLPSSGTSYILEPGAYNVTITYKNSGIVYGEGEVVATIYSGLTTTVIGTVDELVTYAQFEAEQNPDIIARTAGVDGITSTTTGDEQGNINLSEPATVEDKKVSATVPAAAAVALLPKVGEDPDPNASMSLELNVDTTDSTSTSVTYDISMTKIITLNSEVETSDVKELGKDAQQNKYYAVATVQLSKNLTGVKVTHSGYDMVESADTGDDDGHGVYSYDANTGVLTIQTNTFSPFKVTYDGETAGVAEVNGVKYATLAEAVEKAPAGAIVKLLSDAEGSGMSINKSITIDLNEHTYTGTKDPAGSTGTKSQLFQLLQESGSVTIKNGTLRSVAGSGILMLVQNYCNLTLEDVILDGSNIGEEQYTLSNNQGDISITGKTSIIAPKDGIAFDVCSGWGEYKSTKVTVSGGNINGAIEVTDCGSADKVELVIEGGFFAKAIERPEGYQTDKVSISITGGSFAWDPTEYVPTSGYEVLYDETTKLWTVIKQRVAKIGDTYYTSLNDAAVAAVSGNTIELLCDLTFNSDSFFESQTRYKVRSVIIAEIGEGITLDGGNHTITFSEVSNKFLIGNLAGTIKNIDVVFEKCGSCSIVANTLSSASFDYVDTFGSISGFDGNCAEYVIYVWGTAVSFTNCDAHVNVTGEGTDGDYDAVFIGYTVYDAQLTFDKCNNYGTVNSGHVGIFLGNSAYHKNVYNIKDSYNYGKLYDRYGAKGNNPYANIICAVTDDGSLSHSTFLIDGETYSYNQIINGEANDVINKGVYVVGSGETTLSIKENADLTFTVTATEGAAYYKIGVGLYTSLKAGGSTRNFVYETVVISGDSTVTQVKNLAFVDDEWVAEHTDATSTVVVYGDNSYTVFTLGDTSYYLINNTTEDTLHGDVKPATLISVSAFDAYNELISVASLSSN